MADKTDQESVPLTEPAEVDPEWREKIETARQARKLGERLRENKETTFRRSVGRAGS